MSRRYTTAGQSRSHVVHTGYRYESAQHARWEKRQSRGEQLAWCLLYVAIAIGAIGGSLWFSDSSLAKPPRVQASDASPASSITASDAVEAGVAGQGVPN